MVSWHLANLETSCEGKIPLGLTVAALHANKAMGAVTVVFGNEQSHLS